MSKFLTKSNYLTGLNCLKSLWYEKHRKYELPKLDEFTKSIMEQGKEIGEFAKKYFKEKSLDIEKIIEKKFSKEDKNFFKEQIELSKKSLTEKKILFEATFVYERLYSRADILKPNEEGSFDLIEVKSGTKPKTENIEDVAFQYFVYTKCNIKIRKCFIMNVNKNYLFKEERINPIDFFYLTDITKKVLEKQEEVENNIKIFLEVIDLKSFDEKYHTCLNLKKCNYKELFNKKMCENDLFSLKGIREEKLLSFKKLGFKNVEELDLSKIEINEKQKIQFELVKNKKKVHIEKENIKYFLKDLKYPIYFLDFETISKAIPLYKNSTPYEQIPFQFSLHIQKEENSNLEHFEFLQTTKEDPREDFIQKILEYIKDDKGNIVVYFEGFEKSNFEKCNKIFSKIFKKN